MSQWYYARGQQQLGPVTWDKLRELASAGGLDRSDMVWCDGMAQWQKAGAIEGLFLKSGGSAASRRPDSAERKAEERATAERATAERATAPRREESRRRDPDRDERDSPDDDAPRRRRRKKKEEGMSPGAMAGLIGGCIAGGLVVVIIIIVLLVRTGNRGAANQPPPPMPVADPGGVAMAGVAGAPFQPTSYDIRLGEGQQNVRSFQFQQGQRVTINVNTRGGFIQRPDVDLEVTRAGDQGFMMADYSLSENCFVNFIAPATDQYTLRVDNLGPGSASCTVSIR